MFVKRMKSGINLSDIDLLSIHTHKLQGTSRGIRKKKAITNLQPSQKLDGAMIFCWVAYTFLDILIKHTLII